MSFNITYFLTYLLEITCYRTKNRVIYTKINHNSIKCFPDSEKDQTRPCLDERIMNQWTRWTIKLDNQSECHYFLGSLFSFSVYCRYVKQMCEIPTKNFFSSLSYYMFNLVGWIDLHTMIWRSNKINELIVLILVGINIWSVVWRSEEQKRAFIFISHITKRFIFLYILLLLFAAALAVEWCLFWDWFGRCDKMFTDQ